MDRKPIAITVGDPSGVGPEIIASWVSKNAAKASSAVVIGHEKFLSALPDSVEKLTIGDAGFEAVAGRPCPEGARVAFEALKVAARGCTEGKFAAVVTAPISKECMREVGFEYQGQTEFFADSWGGTPVMSFAGTKFIVSLVTWHDSLKDVPKLLDFAKIARAVGASAELAKKLRGVENPRIAVCGLNPHAGENGLIGREEIDLINPALEKLREDFPNLSVSLPPDTVFERVLKGEFDCIVSMYHDQALAPLKAVEFDNAVNVSMNLPHLRVSPDHGTAFGIAGKGIANDGSFSRAFELAEKMVY